MTRGRGSRVENQWMHSRSRLQVALLVIYLILLAWVVIWKLEVPWIGEAALLPRPIKLVPFLPSGDAGASAPLELLANLLLFIPFGFYLGALVRWPWWRVLAVLAGASLILEITQHVLSTGSFDITDVIVNTAGGMLGLWVIRAARLTAPTITRISLIFTVLIVIAVTVFVVSPLRYAAPRDVIVGLLSTSS